MKACVITIGNEVLKGRTVNTNAAEIGRVLYFAGYEIVRGITVPDEPKQIGWAFRNCLEMCEVIVSSGGLGPTFDDMTVSSFAQEFNIPLVLNSEIYNEIRGRFEKRGMEMTEERKKMAYVPQGSNIIKNNVGSAPGIEITIENTKIFILPGVPREMRPMIEYVGPNVKLSDSFYAEESIVIKGIPESALAPTSKELMSKYGENVYIKSHPNLSDSGESIIEMEVSTKSKNPDDALAITRAVLREVSEKAEKIRKDLSHRSN